MEKYPWALWVLAVFLTVLTPMDSFASISNTASYPAPVAQVAYLMSECGVDGGSVVGEPSWSTFTECWEDVVHNITHDVVNLRQYPMKDIDWID